MSTNTFPMTLSPKDLLSSEDMEDFARSFLGLDGTDSDMFYESYYKLNLNDEDYEDEYHEGENTKYTY